MGEPARHTAGGRDDEDVQIPLVVTGEGDLLAVRGEDRITLQPDPGSQAAGVAAGAVHGPQVAGVAERDLLARLPMANFIDSGADWALDVFAVKCVGKSLPGRPAADHFAVFLKI